MAVGRVFVSSAVFVLVFGFFSPFGSLSTQAFRGVAVVPPVIGYASHFLKKGPFSRHGRHVASVPSGRKYLSSRVCLYPNSQISFNLMRLAISGDVNPTPGPVSSKVSKAYLAEPTRKNYVSCLSLNVRSIVNKRVDLCSRLSSTSFDLVAVTETWLKSFLARTMCIVKIAHVMVVAYY